MASDSRRGQLCAGHRRCPGAPKERAGATPAAGGHDQGLPPPQYERAPARLVRVQRDPDPFAFDTERKAILLATGDKAGHWKDWYKRAIPLADDRFDEHLERLERMRRERND